MKSVKLNEEILRINDLMGIKPKLIIEAATSLWPPKWLIDLIADGVSKSKINGLITKIRNTGINDFTDENIDELMDLLKKGGLDDDAVNNLRTLFKKNKEINGLLKTSDNFLDDLQKVKTITTKNSSDVLNRSFTKIATLSDTQIKEFISTLFQKLPSETEEIMQRFAESIMKKAKEKIKTNFIDDIDGETNITYVLNSKDDVYNYMLDEVNIALKNNLDAQNITPRVAEAIFDDMAKRLKTKLNDSNLFDNVKISSNPKIYPTTIYGDASKDLGNLIAKTDGSFDLNYKNVSSEAITREVTSGVGFRTNQVTEFLPDALTKKYNQIMSKATKTTEEDLFIKSVDDWKNKDGLLDDVERQFDNLSDDVADLSDDIDLSKLNNEKIIDSDGQLSSKWRMWIFSTRNQKYFSVLINLLRGMFRSPDEFLKKSRETLSALQRAIDEIEAMSPNVKNLQNRDYNKKLNEINRLSFKLKSDLILAQTPEKMFEGQWNEILKIIDNTIPEYDKRNIFLEYISGKDNPSKILKFLEESKKLTDESSFTSFWTDVARGDVEWKTVFERDWWKRNVGEYTDKLKTILAGNDSFIPKYVKLFLTALKPVLNVLINMSVIGVSRGLGSVLNIIRGRGVAYTNKWLRVTGTQGLKTIALTYVEIMILSNVFEPFINYIKNFMISLTELNNVEVDSNLSSPLNEFKKDLWNLLKIQKWEWNPVRIPGLGFFGDGKYNSKPIYDENGELIGVKDGEQPFGFENAPIPEYILKTLFGVFNRVNQNEINKEVKGLLEIKKEEFNMLIAESIKNGDEKELKQLFNYGIQSSSVTFTAEEQKVFSEHNYFRLYTNEKYEATETTTGNLKNINTNSRIINLVGEARFCKNKTQVDTITNKQFCPGDAKSYVEINNDYNIKLNELTNKKNMDLKNPDNNTKERKKILSEFDKQKRILENERYTKVINVPAISWRLVHGNVNEGGIANDAYWQEEYDKYFRLSDEDKNNPEKTLVAKPLYVKDSDNNDDKISIGQNGENVAYRGRLLKMI